MQITATGRLRAPRDGPDRRRGQIAEVDGARLQDRVLMVVPVMVVLGRDLLRRVVQERPPGNKREDHRGRGKGQRPEI